MIKLIKNEIYKIFKQKTIYILWIIMFLFICLMFGLMKNSSSNNTSNSYMESMVTDLETELEYLNPDLEEDYTRYIELKSRLDVTKYSLNYEFGSWQYQIIQNRLENLFYNVNKYSFGETKDEKLYIEANNKLNEVKENIESGNWKYFVNKELDENKQYLNSIEEAKKTIKDKAQLESLDNTIVNTNLMIKTLNYRLDYDIAYGNSYRSNAVEEYYSASQKLIEYESKSEHTFAENLQYKETKKTLVKSQYIIETGIDVDGDDEENFARAETLNFFNYFGLFIVIITIFISGSIVSSEFSKGTIKLLLVKPYSRIKILLSKYITTVIITIMSILVLLLSVFLVSGVLYGFGSFATKPVIYNYATESMEAISYIKYMLTYIGYNLPYYLMYGIIAFALSTIILNTGASVTISLFVYISSNIVETITRYFDISILKYYITNNIDFGKYIFNAPCSTEGVSITFNLIIYAIYFIAIAFFTILSFRKRNIKNI